MDWWIIFLAIGVVNAQETCLSVQDYPYLLFGTKTSYAFIKKEVPSATVYAPPGCQPTAFWMLNRHGTQNPEANEIIELQKLVELKNNILTNYKNENFKNTKQRICNADLNLLEQWEWNNRINATFAGHLTTDGYMTTQQQAKTWQQKFPGLLTKNRYDYLFKFADDPRSSNTFKAFTEGIFGDQADALNIPKENDEKLLRPYKFCPAWTKEVGENNDTISQLNIFESKREYQEMINNISLRLGFNYDLQKNMILNIYQMCRYNKAWKISEISPWCAAFTHEDLQRLEYAEDLETYYKYGYGSELNKKIGCTLVKEMLQFFEKHLDEGVTPQQPRALIHFSSAAMLLLTLTSLGAHREIAPLTGDNYHLPNIQNRVWSTSTISPYDANLAAVLYKCTVNGKFQVNDPNQILLLENERPMQLEGCKVGLCSWSLIKKNYQELADKCDLDFCNGATNLNGVIGISFAVTVFVVNCLFARI